MYYLFAFSYCSWSSQGKNIEVVCHSLLQCTTFCQTSPPWPVCLGWPQKAWVSFIELDNTVVHVIRLLAVSECGFSLSALWCPLSVPTILHGFLLPWTCGSSSQPLLHHAAPDIEAGFRKAEETEIKLPTFALSSKKQESSRKTSISALLTMPKALSVWITTNCG